MNKSNLFYGIFVNRLETPYLRDTHSVGFLDLTDSRAIGRVMIKLDLGAGHTKAVSVKIHLLEKFHRQF